MSPSPINLWFILGPLLSLSLFSSISTWKIMKDKTRIGSSPSESDSWLLKFLVYDLSFTTQLLRALKTWAMALQFNFLNILPLLWTYQMSFFVTGSRKEKLSWDDPGVKQTPVLLQDVAGGLQCLCLPTALCLSWVCPTCFGMEWLGKLWNGGFVLCRSDVLCLFSFSSSYS